jgi:hypothetical protein
MKLTMFCDPEGHNNHECNGKVIEDEKTMIEKAFEEEITSVYFLGLWFNYTENMRLTKNDLLNNILEHNPQIMEWFSDWFRSLEKYQEDTLEVMKERYDEIIIKK